MDPKSGMEGTKTIQELVSPSFFQSLHAPSSLLPPVITSEQLAKEGSETERKREREREAGVQSQAASASRVERLICSLPPASLDALLLRRTSVKIALTSFLRSSSNSKSRLQALPFLPAYRASLPCFWCRDSRNISHQGRHKGVRCQRKGRTAAPRLILHLSFSLSHSHLPHRSLHLPNKGSRARVEGIG